MHYYQFNIGDYAAHTKHLSIIEDLAYRRMLDIYYTSEKPLPLDVSVIARLICMREYEKEVSCILVEFFQQSEAGYINKRCDREISGFQAMKDGGKKGAAIRWGKGSDSHPIDTPILNNNNEPITNNQDINTKEVAIAPVSVNLPATKSESKKTVMKTREIAILETVPDIPRQVLEDFLTVRHGKNASEFTKTALALIANEAEKAGITTAQAIAIATGRGWQSFKAEWIGRDKTYAEKTQDYKDEQAAKFYKPLLEADLETLKKWGLA